MKRPKAICGDASRVALTERDRRTARRSGHSRARPPRRSASDGDEDRLVVLAGPTTGAPVHVALVPVDESQPGAREDLGIEIAPVVDDDAHPTAERERVARALEHLGDAADVLLDRRPPRAS